MMRMGDDEAFALSAHHFGSADRDASSPGYSKSDDNRDAKMVRSDLSASDLRPIQIRHIIARNSFRANVVIDP